MNRPTIASLPQRGPLHAPHIADPANEPSRTVRGFLIGIVVSLPAWALLAWLVWAVA